MFEFDPHSLEPFWGAWYIEKMIGSGSFGVVYKIYREDLIGKKTYSALKIISIPRTSSEAKQLLYDGLDEQTAALYYKDAVEVFYKEISLMDDLKGKTNIVSYEDYKIVPRENGIGYYILIRMELLECIYDYLLHNPFTDEDAVKLGIDICEALILCQKRKIIHRDIKPANIFITPDGYYKLGDFGIARKLDGVQNKGLSIIGTFEYMAPEVKGSDYDARVDIYSLGLVLYYLLNGRKEPFSNPAKTVPLAIEHQENMQRRFNGEKIPRPALASDKLSDIILKACEHNPEDRYESPAEFKKALESLSEEDFTKVVINTNYVSNPTDSTVLLTYEPTSLNTGNEETVILQTPAEPTGTRPVEPTGSKTLLPQDPDSIVPPVAPPGVSIKAKDNSLKTNPRNPNLIKYVLAAVVGLVAILILVIIFIPKGDKNSESTTADVNIPTASVSDTDEALAVNSSDTTSEAVAVPVTEIPEATPTTAPEVIVPYELPKEGEKLTDLASIENIELLTSLNAGSLNLTSIDELEHSVLLADLYLENNHITSIEKLRDLTRLTSLSLADNYITDISPISGMTSLTSLILSNNHISSLEGLSELKSLTLLQLNGNKELTDISPVSSLTNLKDIILTDTGVTDISPLYDLKNLTLVDITGLSIPQEQIDTLSSKLPECNIAQ